MAIIASWNGKQWEVSSKHIMTIENFTTAYKLKTESGDDSEGKAPSNVRGLELMPLSFTTHISDAVGIDVRAELESWGALVGQSAPFILGDKPLSDTDFRLLEVSLGNTFLDDLGRIREAALSVNFEEYAGEAAKDKPLSTATAATAAKTPGIAKDPAPAKTTASGSGAKKDTNSKLSVTVTPNIATTKSALGIGASSKDKTTKKTTNPQLDFSTGRKLVK
jgi:hypothetical protein